MQPGGDDLPGCTCFAMADMPIPVGGLHTLSQKRMELANQLLRVIQGLYNIGKIILAADEVHEPVLLHCMHWLLVDVRENERDALLVATLSELAQGPHRAGVDCGNAMIATMMPETISLISCALE